MFHPPLLTYEGIAFILSNPGRHDKERLLSGRGGEYFDQCLALASRQIGLPTSITRFNIFIKTLDDPTPIPTGTKVVVLLDSKAQRVYIPTLTLNECRGYCYQQPDGLIYIATYAPESCMDRRFISAGDSEEDDSDSEDDPEAGKEKDHSPTRRKNWKYWFCQDIRKAIHISKYGFKPLLKHTNYQIFLPSTEVINLLSKGIKNEYLYFDIETNPNYRVTVFSFSTGWDTVYTVPLLRYDGTLAYDELETCKILRALSTAIRDNTVVIHNSLFDLFILLWRYKIPPPKHWSRLEDTMVMQHRLQPEVEKSLGHCGSYLTHEEYHKNEIIYVPKNRYQEDQLWRYNAKDVSLLAVIHKELREQIERKGIRDSIQRAQRLLLPYLLQTAQGIRVDTDFKNSNYNELEKKKLQYQRIAKILLGYDIEKLGSWQRVAHYLYDHKGLPKPPAKLVNGVLKHEELTSSGTLYKLRTKFNIPFIDLLLHFRAVGKQAGFLKFNCWTPLEDQFRNIHNPVRFTSTDSITGTNTLRNNSRMLFGHWGSNKQNVEKALRRVGIADEGKELVQSDQGGAEAKVVAYLAPKGKYRTLLEQNIKLYNFVAMHIFRGEWEKELNRDLKEFIHAPVESLSKIEGWKELNKLIKSSDDWPPSRRFYYICKVVVLAANYGMRGPTFQVNMLKKSEGKVVITRKQADFYLDFFHDLFPEIRMWHQLTQAKLHTNGKILENLFGDKREFMGWWDDTLFKEAYAFVPQSTVGMLTNIAIGELQEMIDNNTDGIRELGVDILANGHDAILSQCWKGRGHELAKIQERLLAKTFLVGTPNQFTMGSESTIGWNWAFKDK
jgi:DNA polymerase I-like protein with 3'-5' exonuclease and polymerase domains